MNSRVIAFLVLCVFSISVQAHKQDIPVLFLPDTTVSNSVPFNAAEFIDLRANKESVGSVIDGMKRANLVPQFNLDTMMNQFVTRFTKSASEKGNNKLIVVLRDLDLEQRSNGQFVIGNVYVNMDLYLGRDDQYNRVLSLDSLFEFAIGRDPVKDLAQVYSGMFTGLLLSLSGTQYEPVEPFYTHQDIVLSDSLFKSQFPVYYQTPKAGIYYSVEKFLQNEPDDTLFIHKHYNAGDVITDKFYTTKDGKKIDQKLIDLPVFAVYNGKKWYTPYGNEFKEMKIKNGQFYYMDFGSGLILPSRNNNFIFVPYSGGLVGALIAVGVQTAVYASIKTKPVKVKMGDAVFRYKLNPITKEGIKVERLE